MLSGARHASIGLFLGDLVAFSLSLWLSLFVRSGGIPTEKMITDHALPFALLFCIWTLIFYMAGLYDKYATLFKKDIPDLLFRTQLFNIVLAALFFFVVPFFGIAPKTTLAIYLIFSLALIYLWRLVLYPLFSRRAETVGAALIGSGAEVDELVNEVNRNPRYGVEFRVIRDPETFALAEFGRFAEDVANKNVSVLVVDTESDKTREALPLVYHLSFVSRRNQFADLYEMYEDVFDRVPLSLLRYDWFLKNISYPVSGLYELARRALDIVGGVLMGIITLIITPFIWIALSLEGPGKLFITQKRIGRYGSRMLIYKFRTMRFSDSGAWKGEGENTVTKVGAFLRRTSLDEFPQFINILAGELSLIGPRNDIEALGERLAEAIPYYDVRYAVKPGITGWAQINQQYEQGNISPQSIEETKMRLAYDFYYIKNRSLTLDVMIALKTIKRMLFRVTSW